MSTAFTPTRTRITTDRYQKMVATGVLTKYDGIELIEGEMTTSMPKHFAQKEGAMAMVTLPPAANLSKIFWASATPYRS